MKRSRYRKLKICCGLPEVYPDSVEIQFIAENCIRKTVLRKKKRIFRSLNSQNISFRADTWINDADKNSSLWKKPAGRP